jgi:toxin CcdB
MQSHLLTSHTVLVAPVLSDDGRSAFTQTSVKVVFDGIENVVLVAELAVVEIRSLRRPISNLRDYEDALRRALGRLFTGF